MPTALSAIWGKPVVKLSASERILLHLLEWWGKAGEFRAPPALTQKGIATAAGFHSRHAVQYLRPMIRDGLVRQWMAHVERSRQRQKVYELTETGRTAALRLRSNLLKQTIRVRDDSGFQEMAVGEVLKRMDGSLGLLSILSQVSQSGLFDMTTAQVRVGPSVVEILSEAPRVDGFVGRAKELAVLADEREGAPVIVVIGPPGIGKSWLGAKAFKTVRGRRNLFWHRVQAWDSFASLLADMGRFLAALGRPALQGALARGSPERAARILREDLPGANSLLVFDDVHEADPDAMLFFGLLKDAVTKGSDVRAVVLTRRALPFYDRRDVVLARTVLELELGGLDPEEVAVLLPPAQAEVAIEIGRRVGGHPLFFELARRRPTPSHALGDFRRFLEEEVCTELTEADGAMMKLGSLYRVAVPREALFFGPLLNHAVLLKLTRRSLIRRVSEDRFVVHDTIRDFFGTILTPAESLEFAGFALRQLRTLADRFLEAGNAVAASGALANALELAREKGDRIDVLEALGGAMEGMGYLAGALSAYGAALNLGPEAEKAVRLHRKRAEVHEDRGDVSAARSDLEEAIALLGDGLTEERGWVYVLRCLVARDVEELAEAQKYGQEALRVFRASREPLGEARALLELGYAEYVSPDGDAAVAEQYLRTALALADERADTAFLARVRTVLANVVAYEGRPEEGLALLVDVGSMPIVRSSVQLQKTYLEMRGMISMLLDPEDAETALGESLALARKIGDSVTEAMSEFGFGWVAMHRLRPREARLHFETAARSMEAQGLAGSAVEAHFFTAVSALLEGNPESFRATLGRLRDPSLARGCASRYPHVEALRGIEQLLDKDHNAARDAFAAALRSGRVQWAFHTELLYGAALYAMRAEPEAEVHLSRARELGLENHWNLPSAALPELEKSLVGVLGRLTEIRGEHPGPELGPPARPHGMEDSGPQTVPVDTRDRPSLVRDKIQS